MASASNDHRLGAFEAPPAVVSIFIGQELEGILNAIENDTPYGGREKELIKVGVHALPKIPRDTTDRNRTSPLAFTGNKFELRMVGASSSISGPNVVLNTAVAESLRQYADALEGAEDFEAALHELIRSVIRRHKRIIFNGNGYDDAWLREAEQRGLLNLRTTPDCVPCYLAEKNIELFTRHRVYTETELRARYEIKLGNYCKVLHIEGCTMVDMVCRDILPAVSEYAGRLAASAAAKSAVLPGLSNAFEKDSLSAIDAAMSHAAALAKELNAMMEKAESFGDNMSAACFYRDQVIPLMEKLRCVADRLETLCAAASWPYPGYGELLFSVK